MQDMQPTLSQVPRQRRIINDVSVDAASVKGITKYPLCNGTFFKSNIPPGANNAERAIFKGPGNKFLFYWRDMKRWIIGADYNSPKGWVVSIGCTSLCPTDALGWKEWNPTNREFDKVERIEVRERSECATLVAVSGSLKYPACAGTYTKSDILPNANHAGRMILKGPGAKYMFYWSAINKWVIGDDYNFLKGWYCSNHSGGWCPIYASGWKEWDPATGTFLAVDRVLVQEPGDSLTNALDMALAPTISSTISSGDVSWATISPQSNQVIPALADRPQSVDQSHSLAMSDPLGNVLNDRRSDPQGWYSQSTSPQPEAKVGNDRYPYFQSPPSASPPSSAIGPRDPRSRPSPPSTLSGTRAQDDTLLQAAARMVNDRAPPARDLDLVNPLQQGNSHEARGYIEHSPPSSAGSFPYKMGDCAPTFEKCSLQEPEYRIPELRQNFQQRMREIRQISVFGGGFAHQTSNSWRRAASETSFVESMRPMARQMSAPSLFLDDRRSKSMFALTR